MKQERQAASLLPERVAIRKDDGSRIAAMEVFGACTNWGQCRWIGTLPWEVERRVGAPKRTANVMLKLSNHHRGCIVCCQSPPDKEKYTLIPIWGIQRNE